MRLPDYELDGWCLEDGEDYQRAAPETFWLPERTRRESLQPGDYAKLIFRIALEDADNERDVVERMWVLVRERSGGRYFGLLDNEPDAIEENDELWLGTELPFEARHVIDVIDADARSAALAAREPRRPWPRTE